MRTILRCLVLGQIQQATFFYFLSVHHQNIFSFKLYTTTISEPRFTEVKIEIRMLIIAQLSLRPRKYMLSSKQKFKIAAYKLFEQIFSSAGKSLIYFRLFHCKDCSLLDKLRMLEKSYLCQLRLE